MRALSLFSGIGGLDLAAHAAGIETVALCEIEPFAVQVFERRFPAVENHGDITRFTNRTLRELGGSPFHRFKCPADYNGTIDVVHGGFPCQDLSVAGKQRGLSGERSGLWYEMLRVISELRPAYVVAENVRGACNLALPTVVSGLEGEGYEVRASVVPASAFGAPHKRERLFVLGVRRDVIVPVRDSIGSGKLWPTPRAGKTSDEKLDSWLARRERGEVATPPLSLAVKMWATPSSADCKGSHGGGQGRSLRTDIYNAGGGQLSPAWVECLMNFPLGWTDPDCDEPEPWPGWPAMMGETQYPYEPPRTCKSIPNRAARLKALGNAVVPAQAYPFFEAIRIMEEVRQCNTASST